MAAIALRVLSMVFGTTVAGTIMSSLTWIAVAVGITIVTNLISGFVWYQKGYNASAAKCQMATIIRQRDELQRDRDVQKSIAEETTKELTSLQAREDERAKQEAENAAAVKPIAGCVIDHVPGSVRKPRAKR